MNIEIAAAVFRAGAGTGAAEAWETQRAEIRGTEGRNRPACTYMVVFLHGGGLAALVEVGREAEAALGVLDDADELAPSSQRLFRRVLGLHGPEVLLEVALHLSRLRLPDSNSLSHQPNPAAAACVIYSRGRVGGGEGALALLSLSLSLSLSSTAWAWGRAVDA